MIISASRRTDIPACYADWFFARLSAGYVFVRNPMAPHQISRVALTPDVVDAFVFWTKDPIPMLGRLDELADYPFYFQFTLTGYGRDIEPGVPGKTETLIPAFRALSAQIGPERVIWRYDPILFTPRYDVPYHLRAFAEIAARLAGCTRKCVISFVDFYRGAKKNLQALGASPIAENEMREISGRLAEIAAQNGIKIESCAEEADLSASGVAHGACIDRVLLEKLTGCPLDLKKDPNQRGACLCAASIDIGAYGTCTQGCRYCYAEGCTGRRTDFSADQDPASPFLCSRLLPGDRITERKMISLKKSEQETFFHR